MKEIVDQKLTLLLIIFCIILILSISFGYPGIYLNDEWISANQLNHLIDGKNLLYGYAGGCNPPSQHNCKFSSYPDHPCTHPAARMCFIHPQFHQKND